MRSVWVLLAGLLAYAGAPQEGPLTTFPVTRRPISRHTRAAAWRTTRWIGGASALLLGLLALAQIGIEGRWFRPPYPTPGRELAWWLDSPAPAYHFAEVVPGRLYRSGRPDARLVTHVRETRGVAHVVSLSGPVPAHETARALGMQVTVFEWPGDRLPPAAEIEAVLELLAGPDPVWVHCEHGVDRTGTAVAAYRVANQGWGSRQALAEMVAMRQDPVQRTRLRSELLVLLDELGG